MLAKKRITFRKLRKKIYLSVQAFTRITNGVSALYEVSENASEFVRIDIQNHHDRADSFCPGQVGLRVVRGSDSDYSI